MAVNYANPLIVNATGDPNLDTLKTGSDKLNNALHQISDDLNGADSRYLRRSLNLSDILNATTARSNLGLGTAATANVTTSATDTTAGRVTTTKWGGIGASTDADAAAVTVNNADDATVQGIIYRLVAGAVGNPSGVNSSGSLTVSRIGFSNRLVQTVKFPKSSVFREAIFVRSFDGAWTPWQELYHTGNLQLTTSATDTTAGRVTKVGDFGVGAAVQGLSYDADSYSVGGMWSLPAGDSWVNFPADSIKSHGRLLVMSSDGNYGFQLFTDRANNRLYQRSKSSNWQPWQELYHTGNTGTAVTANVTTSPTDTTAGRVTKVGDFGIGGNAVVKASINASDPTGIYFTADPAFSHPAGENAGLIPHFLRGIDSQFAQLYFRDQNQDGEEMYFRTADAITTSDWKKLYHTGNIIGTVNATDTGALVQYGSNSNGEFWRYAGGMQVCISTISYPNQTVAAGTEVVLTSLNYPISFAGSIIVAGASYIAGFAGSFIIATEGTSTSSYGLLLLRNVTTTDRTVTPTIRLSAIGRWK